MNNENDQHKVLTDGKKTAKLCNCRYKDTWPLAGKCSAKCIAYKAEVVTTDKRTLYYWTSDGDFKARFNNNTWWFRYKRCSTDTELSKYIWKLSNDKIQSKIKWNTSTCASPYKCGSRRRDLCLTEMLKIMREDPELRLSKQSESE